MPSTYTEITLAEFKELLKEEKGWVIKKDKEIIFDYSIPLKNSIPIIIRVYSSISSTNTVSRTYGTDAIRVCLLAETDTNLMGLKSYPRINRTQNWSTAIKDRVTAAIHYAKTLPTCSKCGKPMSERTNTKNGNTFLGCIGYPACKNTVQK